MKPSQKLVKALARGTVIPFVGSGVSMSVTVSGKPQFPSCEKLLRGMTESMDDDDAEIVNRYCNKKSWFKAAEETIEALSHSGFCELMRKRFDIDQPQDADWSVVDALWSLKPSIVATTNYDNVLEWRKSGSRRLLNDQPEELGILYTQQDTDRPRILHLHGHIEKASSLILAPSHYDKLYSSDDSKLQY